MSNYIKGKYGTSKSTNRRLLSDNQNILEIVLPDRVGYQFMQVAEKRVKRVLILDELIFVSEKENETKFELPLHPLHQEINRIDSAAG